MESTRQQKIARLLQKELSEIFRQETAKVGNVIVSVSAVRVSPDLSIARAYLHFPFRQGASSARKHQQECKDDTLRPCSKGSLPVAQDS